MAEDSFVRRRVVTAEEVLRIAREGGRELRIGSADRLTALARDTARDKQIAIVVGAAAGPAGTGPAPTGWPSGPMPAVSRGDPVSGQRSLRRLTHVSDVRRLALDPFPTDDPPAQMDVRLRDVVSARDGLPMAAGVMSLREGTFPWHLDYDEIEYVIEGELHITAGDERVVGRPGDVIAVPKGTSITFGTPSWTKFLYVTYPADWS